MGSELLLGHGLVSPGGSWRRVPRWRNGVVRRHRHESVRGAQRTVNGQPLHLSDLFYAFIQGTYEGKCLGIWARLAEFSNSIPEAPLKALMP